MSATDKEGANGLLEALEQPLTVEEPPRYWTTPVEVYAQTRWAAETAVINYGIENTLRALDESAQRAKQNQLNEPYIQAQFCLKWVREFEAQIRAGAVTYH